MSDPQHTPTPTLSLELIVELAHARTLASMKRDRRWMATTLITLTTALVSVGVFVIDQIAERRADTFQDGFAEQLRRNAKAPADLAEAAFDQGPNTSVLPSEVRVGDSIDLTLGRNEQRLVRLAGLQSGRYEVTAIGHANFDPMLVLMRDGRASESNDDIETGRNLNSQIRFAAIPDLSYHAFVDEIVGTPGRVTLSLREATTDASSPRDP